MEFTLTQIIEQLRAEGCFYLSLGGTYGTALEDHPNADPQIRELLRALHKQNILNGDGNARFKNKFRAQTEPLFLCRAKESRTDCFEDVLLMLSGRSPEHEGPRLTPVRLELPIQDRVYEVRLGPEHLAHLRHHRVEGQAVFPGAAYLEILLAVLTSEFEAAHWTIEGLELTSPLYLEQEKSIQLVVHEESKTSRRIVVYSRDSNSWREHAVCRGTIAAPPLESDVLEIAGLQSRLQDLPVEEFYARLERQGLEHGTAFRGMERLWTGPREALALVNARRLDAAGLDSALQAVAAIADAGLAGWMQGVERATIHKPIAGRFWARAQIKTANPGRIYADVKVYDERRRLALELQGVSAVPKHELHKSASNLSCLFLPAWKRSEPPVVDERKKGPDHWLLLADKSGVAEEVSRALESAGHRVVIVRPGPNLRQRDDYVRMIERATRETSSPLQGIVHLSSLDSQPQCGTDWIKRAFEANCQSALHLTQAALATPWPSPPRIWLASNCAYQLNGLPGVASGAGQSALWGFGRVLATEHPEHRVAMVDLDLSAKSSATLAFVLLCDLPEQEIAVREGEVYVHRLRRAPAAETSPLLVRPDASYLVIGGLGGLGLEAARLLVERGARHVWLAGRTGIPRAARASALEELRAQGAIVHVQAVDATDRAQMENLLSSIPDVGPPLRGVIHSAGVVEDRSIGQISWEELEHGARAKVLGAWNLHELTSDVPLDFFALFSSATALLGPMGQVTHAAACAFLDGLARWRRSLNLPAVSIGWGQWSGTGAADNAELTSRLSFRGIRAMNCEEGRRILEMALGRPEAHLMAIAINWPRWSAGIPQQQSGCLWSDLAGATLPARPEAFEGPRQTDPSIRVKSIHRAVDPGAYVRQQVANLLGVASEVLDSNRPLAEYGFDSLMNISLRNQVESGLAVRIPIVEFFQSTTLAELSAMVAVKTRQPAPQRPQVPLPGI
jgi:myxalamid-type polyketide synthase MxaE and MxaD